MPTCNNTTAAVVHIILNQVIQKRGLIMTFGERSEFSIFSFALYQKEFVRIIVSRKNTNRGTV